MDESVVAVLNAEDQMEENGELKPVLEVSVSFGRFENDLLSWEKWSTFSPNKYLEEVEKYATPGSVAQKRAYFEAHYKKIADRKTKLLEQEMQMEGDATVSNDLNSGDIMTNGGVDTVSETSNYQVSAEEIEQNTTIIDEVSSTYRDEVKDDVGSIIECESSAGGEKEELDHRLDCIGFEIDKQEAIFVRVATPPIETQGTEIESQRTEKEPQNIKKEIQSTKEPPQKPITKISIVSKIKTEAVKSNQPKESKKVTSVKKEPNISIVKKKQVLSTAKTPQISTPKLSKTIPASITSAPRSPAPRSSTTKGNTLSSSRSRIQSAGEGKKVTPKSLHMSLSLGTPNSDPTSVTAIRRSFIMESMGDKDIVKRAFKTFQNSFKQRKSSPEEQQHPSIKKSSPEERSSIPKQVPAKGKETKISTSGATRKVNGGLHKISGLDSKIPRIVPSQKLEGKSYPKVAGRTNLQSKSKVVPSQKLEEKFNAREGGRTNLQSKSKEISKNGIRH